MDMVVVRDNVRRLDALEVKARKGEESSFEINRFGGKD